MKNLLLIKQLALLMVLSISWLSAQADDFRARIVKVQGEVYIINSKGEQRKPEKSQNLVNKMETVVTKEGSKAVVQFDDGAMSVLDEKSSLRVEQTGWLSQLGGKVYYVFRKVFGKKKPRKVKTKFATIGIRGTTFIVYEEGDNKGVALQEGKLNIESPGKDYEIRRQQQTDDFEAFKQQAQERAEALDQEYSDYKSNLNREFVEYKKSFDLEANRVVSFDDNRVSEKELSDDFKMEFDDFKNFSKDYIDAYKELDSMENESY
ncbi:MAG: FecR domain-containing protein [Gammaproteobacteria bacterium]|nr:FecR domain-containing protein [Gammaproteobacteria bacterium]